MKGQPNIEFPDALLMLFIAFGLSGLAFKACHLPFYFRNYVGNTPNVLVRSLNFTERFFFTGLIPNNSRSLLNEYSSFFRPGISDCADFSLLNHGVGFRSHIASHKDIMYIL